MQKHHYRPALLIVLIGFGLAAAYNLGFMSVQWDEMPHLYGGLLLNRMQIWDYMTTYGYYPPIFDLVTTGYFQIFGVNHLAGRLVAVTFSLLAIWAVFELTKKTYGEKNALIASVLLATMPGFFWLSRVAMLETMLIFFSTLVMLAFHHWIIKNTTKTLVFSGLVLGVGVLAKYQILVAALAMIPLVIYLCRCKLKLTLPRLFLMFAVMALVVTPWFVINYHYNDITKFETLQYVMSEGGQDRPAYSNRFQPIPIFYIVEMAWPFNDIAVHPISLPILILGLCGLALFAYRRKNTDLFFLIWFLTFYVFFTFVPNRQWRYITPVFPIMAISAASFLMFLWGKISRWRPAPLDLSSKRLKKAAGAVFVVVVLGAVAYSGYDAYGMTVRDQINIPIQEATAYLANNLGENQSAVLVCAFNLLDQNMFRFYLPENMRSEQVWQYPDLAVDAFIPNFDLDEFLALSVERNVKYIILFDWGPNTKFFNSTLDYQEVQTQIYQTGRFDDPLDRPFFGPFKDNKGYRLFLVRFLG